MIGPERFTLRALFFDVQVAASDVRQAAHIAGKQAERLQAHAALLEPDDG